MIRYPQLWLVFFGPGDNPGALARILPSPWRHVCCACYQGDQDRWVYVNPARDRTYVLVMKPEQFTGHFDHLLTTSTAILEFPAMDARAFSPTWASCVGAVKGILGIRSYAFTPYGLYRDLRALGAESFGSDQPAQEGAAHELNLWRRRHTDGSAGRSGGGAGAANGGSPLGSGADQGAAGPAQGRD